MQIKKTKRDNFIIISLAGSMDAYDAEKFESEAAEIVKSGQKQIIVNLEKLDYISSSGLRALLSMRAQLSKGGGKFRLVSLRDKVLEVFRISKLLNIFEIFENAEDAIKS